MVHRNRMRQRRRGMSAIQTAIVLAFVAVGVAFAANSMSSNTAADMETTAEGVADPGKLAERFK